MEDKAQYFTQTLHSCALASCPNPWTGEQLQSWGCLQGYTGHLHCGCWWLGFFSSFFLSFKTVFNYTGQMTDAFPKPWSKSTWVPGPAPKPVMRLLRGHTRYSQTAQCFTRVKTEQTAGTSYLCAEGATHTDPRTPGTFTGWYFFFPHSL